MGRGRKRVNDSRESQTHILSHQTAMLVALRFEPRADRGYPLQVGIAGSDGNLAIPLRSCNLKLGLLA